MGHRRIVSIGFILQSVGHTLLTYLLEVSRTLLSSASNGYAIGRIPVSLYHFGIKLSSSHRFWGLSLVGSIQAGTRVLYCGGAVGEILLTCEYQLILLLLAICFACCIFTRRLISSFLILPILIFPIAFSDTPHICCCQHLPFFAGDPVPFSLW